MYTFGAPRNGLQDFAVAEKDHLGPGTGSSWRIANKGDTISLVPPILSGQAPFVQVDTGYLISPDDAPVKLPSEINMNPPPPPVIPTFLHHGAPVTH
ncbi:hypothetical protein FRC12_023178 [Ceratobasidium sp. 428]|nr:hypothetical protein FRC12_023178 [Ceratobasidium sp. 428]